MSLTFDQLPQAFELFLKKIEDLERLIISQSKESQSASAKPLTIEEAADFLHLSIPQMYILVKENEGLGQKSGKRWYFFEKILIDFINTGGIKTKLEMEAKTDSYIRKGRREDNGNK